MDATEALSYKVLLKGFFLINQLPKTIFIEGKELSGS